jgi:hypothetical protein
MLFTAETLFGLGFGAILRLGLGCSILAELSLNLLLRVIKTSFIPTTVKKHVANSVAVNKKPKNALVTVFIKKEYLKKITLY